MAVYQNLSDVKIGAWEGDTKHHWGSEEFGISHTTN